MPISIGQLQSILPCRPNYLLKFKVSITAGKRNDWSDSERTTVVSAISLQLVQVWEVKNETCMLVSGVGGQNGNVKSTGNRCGTLTTTTRVCIFFLMHILHIYSRLKHCHVFLTTWAPYIPDSKVHLIISHTHNLQQEFRFSLPLKDHGDQWRHLIIGLWGCVPDCRFVRKRKKVKPTEKPDGSERRKKVEAYSPENTLHSWAHCLFIFSIS